MKNILVADYHQSKIQKTVQVGVLSNRKLVPRKNLHNGHKLYELNELSGILDEVKYESKTAFFKGPEEFVYEEKHGCIYIPALNEENALRKYSRIQRRRGVMVKEIK